MTTERTELLAKVNKLIDKRKKQLLEQLPSVHEVEDGIIIRFFAEWDNCDDNNCIKYKRIITDNPNEVVLFYYLPKGAYFELKERAYINCIVCLNGSIEILMNNEIKVLNANHKICLDTHLFEGRALENTYLVTTNNQPSN
jgi:hypothetical protein